MIGLASTVVTRSGEQFVFYTTYGLLSGHMQGLIRQLSCGSDGIPRQEMAAKQDAVSNEATKDSWSKRSAVLDSKMIWRSNPDTKSVGGPPTFRTCRQQAECVS